ncbi:hypothetical protein B0H19DRAFT_1194719 [Mycena capillaripes]|nr:hypothetical protein B0H19DRAFT_1194719 [Mycena capillaripes]
MLMCPPTLCAARDPPPPAPGVKRILRLIYEQRRGVLKILLENVIRDSVTNTEHHKRCVCFPFLVPLLSISFNLPLFSHPYSLLLRVLIPQSPPSTSSTSPSAPAAFGA